MENELRRKNTLKKIKRHGSYQRLLSEVTQAKARTSLKGRGELDVKGESGIKKGRKEVAQGVNRGKRRLR